MGYVAFEICQVPVGGQQKRGAKAKCGHCEKTESIHINTSKSHGDDDEQVERNVIHKFEKLGWKIGKTATQHRCPGCYAALKAAAKRRNNGDNKVVPINPVDSEPTVVVVESAPAAKRPTRDDRRIIHNRIDENYVSEAIGYAAGWSDKRVAEDLGVPIVWVAEIRDENFGPNIDEASQQTISEAKALIEELKAAHYTADPIVTLLVKLEERAARIEKALLAIAERK